mmetsp:Transcript_12915/g.26027  ORF Transcript_12915/g.26027 Transcript_12915/m.26027 type:complete len:98 (-) Transcript_12915:327-620(-)
MISSTASKESAPKSSVKEALSSKPSSTPNWEMTSSRTCFSTPLRAVTERVATGTGAKAAAEPTRAARTRDLACEKVIDKYKRENERCEKHVIQTAVE